VSERQQSSLSRRPNRRLRPVIALGLVAFLVGVFVGGAHSSSSTDENLAERFAHAWTRHDYSTLYSLIGPAAHKAISATSFSELYSQAEATATATTLRVLGRAKMGPGDTVTVPVAVHTRLFGVLHSSFRLPVAGSGSEARIAWSRSLEFPGLNPGQLLHRRTELPPRATLLARDGSVLASGAADSSGPRQVPLGSAGSAIVGTIGPPPPERLKELEDQGVPANAEVGLSGLELAFDTRLRGTPGGELLAGERVLARSSARAAPGIRSTISPSLQQTAVAALGTQYGGIVAMKPSGEVLAVAGIGLDSLQPPGSTFKMVTITGVLEAGIAHSTSTFPYATYTTLDGVKLSNANGESCGGSLALAFAVSCNSVFAPLGVKLGAERLVATAEHFGFNHSPGIPGAAQSSIPPASEIQGELDLGSTAIGQGQVSASALQMATVAATIGQGGRRPQPTFTPLSHSIHSQALGVRATSASVARTVRRLMIDVVREGTGTAAAIAGVIVAGKTGTAELGSPTCASKAEPESQGQSSESGSEGEEGCSGSTSNPQDTDAWFAAFAPAIHPRIVVGVLLVKDGAGGATAAPVAREVLLAALQSHL
jgi:hypothetical protein